MSRSYKFRNKDNQPNAYLKQMFGPSSFRSKHEGLIGWNETYSNKLKRNHVNDFSVPKWFRKNYNRRNRKSDSQKLKQAIATNSYDEMTLNRWLKDAGYDYF